MEILKEHKCFGGWLRFYQHFSDSCQCNMRFSAYIPHQAEKRRAGGLFWLSGLTCTEENFMIKSGVQKHAAKYGLVIIAPDTSPRNCKLEGEEDSWDFGTGAGFYLNATESPWNRHYHMYSYISEELYSLVTANFPIEIDRIGIFGHSMGGHGAITIGLRNPDKYKSVSALAPICNLSQCPWGKKALGNYLGNDHESWKSYDACEVIKTAKTKMPLLVDQGTKDDFLKEQLLTENLEKVCSETSYPLTLRMQKNYDHSFFFVASFLKDHFKHHLQYL